MSDPRFAIGVHRPVYLWAGPGTVRMNRLKFMDAPVNETVHAEAHTPIGARRVAQEAGFNWAYLTYDWGFPPEIEQEDWEDFRRAVQAYHTDGVQVFGYVQTSNCVYDGSYRDADWYALNPRGHLFHYYTGRYMTCWSHPGWLEHLREMVRGLMEAGADGVFFDNPWHGIQPLHLGGAWMGPAGCYCDRCRVAFWGATGLEIPTQITPESDQASRRYARWRAEQVTGTLAALADYARSLNPDVVISANDFDAVMRPSYLVYGIDLPALAQVQDVVMIEDFALPRWEGDVLVNNALTLRTARALIGDAPLSTIPYDEGIGFDAVYAARRFQQALAEAAACGAAMVVKGTEYVQDGVFTLLTAEPFAPQREAIGEFHRWLAEHADLYQRRESAASVGLLHPGDALWQAWDRLAPLYFGAGQALLASGVAWRVVTAHNDLSNLDVLLTFDAGSAGDLPSDLRIVSVPDLSGWELSQPSFLARHATVRILVSKVAGWLFQAYFRWRWARRVGDGLELTRAFLQSPFFRLPPTSARQALLAALGERPHPRLTAEAPVLVEQWRRGERWQLHLVNYAPAPQTVAVETDQPVAGHLVSPDRPAAEFRGARFRFRLDVYAVLEYSAEELTKTRDRSPPTF